MVYYEAKMHQIRFRQGLGPDPAPADSLAGFQGPTSKEREWRERI